MGVVLGVKGPAVTAMAPFALAVIAGLSLFVSSLSPDVISASTGIDRVRLFKGESVRIPLDIGSSSGRWMSLTSISLSDESWADGKVGPIVEGRSDIVVTPRIAGRFEGLSAVANEVDPLGLFEYHRTVKIEVQLESLPTALRAKGEMPKARFFSVGDNPSGSVGTGQEMFGISEYQRGLETRDIMWKRVAKLPQDSARLPMRVREGSTKKTVKVGLAIGSGQEQEKREATVDKVAEALGQLGNDLLLIGAGLEVFYRVGGRLHTIVASNRAELDDLVVGAWIESDGMVDPREMAANVDLLILESDNPAEVKDLAENGPTPLLVVSSASKPMRLPPRTVAFTGREDLTELAGRVLTA